MTDEPLMWSNEEDERIAASTSQELLRWASDLRLKADETGDEDLRAKADAISDFAAEADAYIEQFGEADPTPEEEV